MGPLSEEWAKKEVLRALHSLHLLAPFPIKPPSNCLIVVNGSQLAKMEKGIPHMSLPWNL